MLRKSSVSIARDRVKALVISDRVHCTPDAYNNICRELFISLSKYMELTEDDFQVNINRTQVVITFAGEDV